MVRHGGLAQTKHPSEYPGRFKAIIVNSYSKESAMTEMAEPIKGIRYVWPLLFVLAFLGLFFAEVVSSYYLAENPWQKLLLTVKSIYWSFYSSVHFLSPWLYIGVPAIFILEMVMPVQRGLRLIGASTRVDLFYTVFMIPFYGVTVPLFIVFYARYMNNIFGSLT